MSLSRLLCIIAAAYFVAVGVLAIPNCQQMPEQEIRKTENEVFVYVVKD